MKTILNYFEIKIPNEEKNRALSLILEKQLTYKSSKFTKDFLVLTLNKRQKNRIFSVLSKRNFNVEIREIQGYFSQLLPLKCRWGLYIGALLMMLTLFFSQRVIWRIDIVGNTNASDAEIRSELESAGLHLGTFIPSIDYDVLHNKVLLESNALAWLSVNIQGNVATVLVKEKQKGSAPLQSTYTNVVAKCDGYIESVFIKNGKKMIKIGDVVKKGDILISGIIDSQSQGVKYEHASGEIKAYVNKEINIKIPLNSTVKVYTGNVTKYNKYKFYNFSLKILTKYNNLGGLYDTIEKKEMLTLLGVNNLPIEVATVFLYEYTNESVTYTEKQAGELAYADLTAQLNDVLSCAEIISKSIITSCDGEYFYLTCKIYCIEDIAEEKEFYISK